MEDVGVKMDLSVYKGARVFITGHTGFKGSWLCEILLLAGAEVHGYALCPPTKPSLFRQLRLDKRIASHMLADIRDFDKLKEAIKRVKPHFIFHLAAQPLVRESYKTPLETFDANVMGTVNVLEATRSNMAELLENDRACAVVCITTDKCYENDDSGTPFKESDPLGGADPYSASKGACEIAIAAYRRSFFSRLDSPVRVASARAGNVIGGGDWAKDRIVPDTMRAFLGNEELVVRNRRSTRPWQHVLEPLSGYLALGSKLSENPVYATAFNFGPNTKAIRTVWNLVKALEQYFPRAKIVDHTERDAVKEAKNLMLDSGKASEMLGWKPRWGFMKTMKKTAEWYIAVANGESVRMVTDSQIKEFFG